MGYELHIVRAENWTREDDGGIGFDEWERLVDADPDLTIDYSGRLSGDDLQRIVAAHPEFEGCRTERGYSFSSEQDRRIKEVAKLIKQGHPTDIEEIGYDTADWHGHPRGEDRCFWFDCGTICTKNPDVATIDKMLELSQKLNARVVGDDGEVYRRSERGFECYTLEEGWRSLKDYHWGRPYWAPTIIREIARGE